MVFEGQRLQDLEPEAMRRLRGSSISMVFQEPMTSLNPASRSATRSWRRSSHKGVGARIARARASKSCARSASPRRTAARRLSAPVFGRHAAARDDRHRPRLPPALLIADEPTTALDVTIQAQILDLLRGLQAEHGFAWC